MMTYYLQDIQDAEMEGFDRIIVLPPLSLAASKCPPDICI